MVGATYPSQMKTIREIAPKITFLVPGLGSQGGTAKDAMENGLRADGLGLIISSSRAIIHASVNDDFAQKASEIAKKNWEDIFKHWQA